MQFNASQLFWVQDELVSYVNSPDPNAYPSAGFGIVEGSAISLGGWGASDALTYYDSATIVDGAIQFSGEHTLTITSSNAASLVGKYTYGWTSSTPYKITSVDTADYTGGGGNVYGNPLRVGTVAPVIDGYTYTALGQLGNKAQIATGSYTGTGTYGSSNPTSLTFDFEPQIIFIANGLYLCILFPSAKLGMLIAEMSSISNVRQIVSSNGLTVSWYVSNLEHFASSSYQMNNGLNQYIAIG